MGKQLASSSPTRIGVSSVRSTWHLVYDAQYSRVQLPPRNPASAKLGTTGSKCMSGVTLSSVIHAARLQANRVAPQGGGVLHLCGCPTPLWTSYTLAQAVHICVIAHVYKMERCYSSCLAAAQQDDFHSRGRAKHRHSYNEPRSGAAQLRPLMPRSPADSELCNTGQELAFW